MCAPVKPSSEPQAIDMESKLSHSAVVACPRNMVGRVIGKGGETIKALQQYTHAVIQIDQSQDPTRVTVAGEAESLKRAVSIIQDIVHSKFKGFAMLRQMGQKLDQEALSSSQTSTPSQPVYVEGYGFVPPSQFAESDDLHSHTNLPPLAPHKACSALQQQAGTSTAASAPAHVPLDLTADFSGSCTGLPDNYEHLLQMLSLCQQQQQQPQQIPSSNAYIHNQTPAKPVMAHHLPAGIMHSTSNASLYADSPTTPTQVLDATLALSANESYGSPTSSSFGSSPGSIPSVQITAAPTSPSYPLQGLSLPQSTPVSHSLFSGPNISTVTGHSLPMDLPGSMAQDPLMEVQNGWMVVPDPNGRRFYHNRFTQESIWESALCY